MLIQLIADNSEVIKELHNDVLSYNNRGKFDETKSTRAKFLLPNPSQISRLNWTLGRK